MKGKFVGLATTISFALVVLLVSFFKSAEYKLAYSPMVLSEKTESEKPINIDYNLAYQGKFNPDNPIWYAKVVRDKVWYVFTFDKSKKAELNLLFADKRLNSSLELFKENKPDLGLSTLTKSGKYLETSSELVQDTDLYKKIALSSLKHRQVIEEEILPMAPDDLRPEIIKAEDYCKNVYKTMRDKMLSKGMVPPVNPFEKN